MKQHLHEEQEELEEKLRDIEEGKGCICKAKYHDDMEKSRDECRQMRRDLLGQNVKLKNEVAFCRDQMESQHRNDQGHINYLNQQFKKLSASRD